MSTPGTYIKFEKLDFLRMEYTSEQNLFKSLALFDFEPSCVQEDAFVLRNNKLQKEMCSNNCTIHSK